MKLGKKELDWLGAGWYWDYDSSIDFKGRHAVNIQTDSTLSVREAQSVQRGEQDLQQAILKRYGPISTGERSSNVSEYLIVQFSSLAGAIQYAAGSERTSYIVGHGRVRVPYPDDVGGYGFRSLMSGRHDHTYYTRENNILSIYNSYAINFVDSPKNTFYVWEHIR